MIAVSAWFEAPLEAAVRDLWRRMAEAGIDASLHAGPYRPHVTLGVWEELDREAAVGALRDLPPRLAVTFRAIGVFPGGGVYLTPTVTRELALLHERVHAVLRPVARRPVERHLPGRWEPHCTLAWELPLGRLPDALAVALSAAALPLDGTIDRVGVIETPAEVELDCVPL